MRLESGSSTKTGLDVCDLDSLSSLRTRRPGVRLDEYCDTLRNLSLNSRKPAESLVSCHYGMRRDGAEGSRKIDVCLKVQVWMKGATKESTRNLADFRTTSRDANHYKKEKIYSYGRTNDANRICM